MGGNSGIQVSGGGFVATNVAAGDNASVTVGGDASGPALDAAALRALLRDAPASEDGAEAERAARTLAEEAAEPAPDRDKARAALTTLERLCKAGGALAGFADKAAPLLARLAAALG